MKNLTEMSTKEQMIENAATMVEIMPSLADDREYKMFQRTVQGKPIPSGLPIWQRYYKTLLDLFVSRYGWQNYENLSLTDQKIATLAEMGVEAVPTAWDNGSGHVLVSGKQF